MIIKKIYVFAYLWLILLTGAYSQSYRFITYGVEAGLNHPYIYSLALGDKGNLWVATADGLYRYDGASFKLFDKRQGLPDDFTTSVLKDKKGGLWIGHNQGSVSYYNKNKFITTIEENNLSENPIIGFTEDNTGRIWCLTQNSGISLIKNTEKEIIQKQSLNAIAYSFMSTFAGNGILLGTGGGLEYYEIKNDSLIFKQKILSIPPTKIQCIVKGNGAGQYWIGTEDEGVFSLMQTDNKFFAKKMGDEFGLSGENIQYVLEDEKSSLWIGTFSNGLYKLSLTKNKSSYEMVNFTESNGFKNKFVKNIFKDREGNIWVGTYGGGLVKAVENYFTSYEPKKQGLSNNIVAITKNLTNTWVATENDLLKIQKLANDEIKFIEQKKLPGIAGINSLYLDSTNNLWLGTSERGIYTFDPNTEKYSPFTLSDDNISKYINRLTGDANNIWIGTKGGLFRYNIQNKKLKVFNTENGLLHNNITALYVNNGTAWCGTPGNYIAEIKNDTVINHKIGESNDIITISCITADKKGNIWFGTQGNGIFMYNKKTFINFDEQGGVFSNYCYSIIADNSGNIWIGHRHGLSRLNTKNLTFKTYGPNEKIIGDCNPNAISVDEKDELWIGLTGGLFNYDPLTDKKLLPPPLPTILSAKFSDKEIDFSTDFILPYEKYKLKIDFKAISFNESEKLTYTYKLEGHDVDWSEPGETNYAAYNSIADGDYTFLVKACNRAGLCNAEPVKIHFTIKSPIWKQWWFILPFASAIIYSLIVFIRLREKKLKNFQQYLKTMLDDRTRLVVAQKEELEKKNKDITDSINYAKRIQEAILPPINKLKTTFPESFVYYRPRDIISGDFYWYHQYGDKFIVACADSTGHGVPGALMSMIGSTLLKEFSSKQEINSPAELLKMLDSEIKKMVQQHDGNLGTNDGLDISVCEIDLKNLKVRIACAARPVILLREGELHYVTRKVGTTIDALENIEVQLQKGDNIYMFTDGYPDQFGGLSNKKLKVERFKNMVKEWHQKPMEQQKKFAQEYFEAWKGNYDQVDDVLLIGIRI